MGNKTIFLVKFLYNYFGTKKSDDYNDAKRIVVISLKKRIKKCFVFPHR